MSKTIASLLLLAGLCAAPFPIGAAANLGSAAIAAEEIQMVAISEEDEDIISVDPSLDEEIDMAAASDNGQDLPDDAPTTGFAAAIVEITQSQNAPITGIAVAVEPEVIETIARNAVAEEPVQTASNTTDMNNVSQMVSSLDNMEGKLVMDRNGELMGKVVGVDYETTTIEVELADGRRITLLDLPVDLGNGYVSVDLTDVELSPVADPDDLLRIDCQ